MERHTHGRDIYMEKTYTWKGHTHGRDKEYIHGKDKRYIHGRGMERKNKYERDIHTKRHIYRKVIHIKGHTHKGTYIWKSSTYGAHGKIYMWMRHIHKRDIHIKGHTHGEIYTRRKHKTEEIHI